MYRNMNGSAHTLAAPEIAVVATLADCLDGLDVIVNCAGGICRDDEFDPDVFEQVININLNGTMRICTAMRPLWMLAGDIVRDRNPCW